MAVERINADKIQKMQPIESNQKGVLMKIRQNNDPYNIGNNIRKIRRQNHLTQEQTIIKMQLLGIEISRSIYSQIECGVYNIKVTELLALSQIFQVDIGDFFEGMSL